MNFHNHYVALFAIVMAIVVLSAGCTDTPAITPAETPSIPNIVGVWTGTTIGHTENYGYREQVTARYNITEQKGQSFTGYKAYVMGDGKEGHEYMSGVISFDGKSIYMADHDDGVISGQLMGPNEVELIYVMDGDNAMALLIHLTRCEN